MDCSPPECRNVGRWVALGYRLHFASQTEKFISLFVGIPFVAYYKSAESFTQQIARANRKRPPLVRGHHWSPAIISYLISYNKQNVTEPAFIKSFFALFVVKGLKECSIPRVIK